MTMTSIDPSAGGSAARSMRGRAPAFNPRVGGELLDATINSFTLTLGEGHHTSGAISVVSTTLENTDGILDSPITFLYGAPPKTEPFFGYVTKVTDEQQASGQLSFTLEVLGATKIMFEGKPRFWSKKTATSAMHAIVNSNGLALGGHTHTHEWTSLAQTNESDWEMVNKLAKRIGYSVFVRYGVVLAIDPVRQYKECGPYCRLVSGSDDPNSLPSTDRNMLEFSNETLSDMVQANLGSKFGYFAGSDVKVLSQSGDFAGFVFESTTAIRDQAEAQTYISAYGTKTDGWAELAVARIWGDADIWPGTTVDVVTASERFYRPAGDGTWLIRSVAHQGDRSQYQTLLFLTRPKADTSMAYDTVAYQPFWERFTPVKPKPTLVLREGVWISSWNDPVLRGVA